MPDAPPAVPKFAQRIKQTRERLGWRQDDLARRAQVNRTTICRLESGAMGQHATLAKVADALGVTVTYLVGDHDGAPHPAAPPRSAREGREDGAAKQLLFATGGDDRLNYLAANEVLNWSSSEHGARWLPLTVGERDALLSRARELISSDTDRARWPFQLTFRIAELRLALGTLDEARQLLEQLGARAVQQQQKDQEAKRRKP